MTPVKRSREVKLLITRRLFCYGTTASLATATSLAAAAMSAIPYSFARAAETVPISELMQPGALRDMAMGDPKAPVTIIEYASMTCSHCAQFHETTFPELKKRYIDTGKVRFILREFPLDGAAVAAFMLARCAGELDSNKYFELVGTLFHEQQSWAVNSPVSPLLAIAERAGFSKQSFEACLSNQKLAEAIEATSRRASNKFKVQATPTFFINGEKVSGAISIEEMAKFIEPHLKS